MASNPVTASMVVSNVTIVANTSEQQCMTVEYLFSTWFYFGNLNLTRVILIWILFALSLAENIFVLSAMARHRSDHFTMFNLILSNIAFTVFVMPLDAIWNTTMQWRGGIVICRLSQMLKQFGMYASSFMVVALSLERVLGVLCPMSGERSKKNTWMVAVAWFSALMCCIPAAVIYTLKPIETCEGVMFYQCVDFEVVRNGQGLAIYYLYTMFMSFILPFTWCLVSYSLIVCEISNMKKKALGRGATASDMQVARRKTLLLKNLVALTFLICWGPYYGKGIFDWFTDHKKEPPTAISVAMYVIMYFNPVIQPMVFGFYLKEVRNKLKAMVLNTVNCFRNEFFKGEPPLLRQRRRSSYNYSVTRYTVVHNNGKMEAIHLQEPDVIPQKVKGADEV